MPTVPGIPLNHNSKRDERRANGQSNRRDAARAQVPRDWSSPFPNTRTESTAGRRLMARSAFGEVQLETGLGSINSWLLRLPAICHSSLRVLQIKAPLIGPHIRCDTGLGITCSAVTHTATVISARLKRQSLTSATDRAQP
jgi:hypothetical protein